jgi:hypothetical protein
MNQNTFRILVGETAKDLIDPSHIEEINQILSQAKFSNITFERVQKTGSVQVGRSVNLSGTFNLITANPKSEEIGKVFPNLSNEQQGRATRLAVSDINFQKFISSENLVDQISTTATSQLYVSPGILQKSQGTPLRGKVASLALPFHEIGHAASHNAGLFDRAISVQNSRNQFVRKYNRNGYQK